MQHKWKSFSHQWSCSHLRLIWSAVILMELEWVGQLQLNRNDIIINNRRMALVVSLQLPWNNRWVLSQATQPMHKSMVITIRRVIGQCQWAGKKITVETLYRMASISNSKHCNSFSKQRSWVSHAGNTSRRSLVVHIRVDLYRRPGLVRAGSLPLPLEALNVRLPQWLWQLQKENNLKEEALRAKLCKYN